MKRIIMLDIYAEIADYISGVLYYNEQWKNDIEYFDFESIIVKEDILRWFGGRGYTDTEITYCYTVLKNHYIHCKALNREKTKYI